MSLDKYDLEAMREGQALQRSAKRRFRPVKKITQCKDVAKPRNFDILTHLGVIHGKCTKTH